MSQHSLFLTNTTASKLNFYAILYVYLFQNVVLEEPAPEPPPAEEIPEDSPIGIQGRSFGGPSARYVDYTNWGKSTESRIIF